MLRDAASNQRRERLFTRKCGARSRILGAHLLDMWGAAWPRPQISRTYRGELPACDWLTHWHALNGTIWPVPKSSYRPLLQCRKAGTPLLPVDSVRSFVNRVSAWDIPIHEPFSDGDTAAGPAGRGDGALMPSLSSTTFVHAKHPPWNRDASRGRGLVRAQAGVRPSGAVPRPTRVGRCAACVRRGPFLRPRGAARGYRQQHGTVARADETRACIISTYYIRTHSHAAWRGRPTRHTPPARSRREALALTQGPSLVARWREGGTASRHGRLAARPGDPLSAFA